MTSAKIIWYAKQGEDVPEIAKRLELCEKTTRLWLKRFNELGMKGLEESPRSGRPPIYPPEQIALVIQTALTKPEELDQPFASWTLGRLQVYINEVKGIPIKRSRISEIFLAEGLGWRHEETWFGERVYAILDNLNVHRSWDVLLFNLTHPRWEFVFQPRYAAYLNLIEPWWKTLRSLAFKGRRFETWQQMEEAVKKATTYWNAHKHPFVWGRRRRHRPRRRSGIAVLPKIS